MKIIDVQKSLPWKGSNGKMDPKKIKFLVVHHDAIPIPARYNTMARILQIAKLHVAQPKRFGGHIAYHYTIDNIGDVYRCFPETEVGYHAGNLPVNKASIAVMLQGNFETQKPTQKQIEALTQFIKWMTTERPDLPLVVKSTIKLHKEVRKLPTACPGKYLIPVVNKLRK